MERIPFFARYSIWGLCFLQQAVITANGYIRYIRLPSYPSSGQYAPSGSFPSLTAATFPPLEEFGAFAPPGLHTFAFLSLRLSSSAATRRSLQQLAVLLSPCSETGGCAQAPRRSLGWILAPHHPRVVLDLLKFQVHQPQDKHWRRRGHLFPAQ